MLVKRRDMAREGFPSRALEQRGTEGEEEESMKLPDPGTKKKKKKTSRCSGVECRRRRWANTIYSQHSEKDLSSWLAVSFQR